MRVVCALLLVAAALAAPAASLAAWTEPDDLSADGASAFGAQVVADASGNSVVAWSRLGRVQARGRGADGSLGPTQTLSPSGAAAQDPDMAGDPAGDAVVVWRRSDGFNDRIQAVSRSAGGALGVVQTLSTSGQSASAQRVAVDQTGDALIAWLRSDGAVDRAQMVFRSSVGSLGPVQTLSVAGQSAGEPQVVMNPGGDGIVAWTRFDGTTNRVQVRARSSGGVLAAGQTVSAAGQTADSPQVAIDSAGNALVVWRNYDGTNLRIQARARSAAGVLGPTRTLSGAGENAGTPQVALDAAGNGYIVWQRFDGTSNRIQMRVRDTSGALTSSQTLSPAGFDASEPRIGVDQSGNALALWTRFDGVHDRLEGRARNTAGTLLPVAAVSAFGHDGFASDLSVNATGQAVAVWERIDTVYNRVQASGGP